MGKSRNRSLGRTALQIVRTWVGRWLSTFNWLRLLRCLASIFLVISVIGGLIAQAALITGASAAVVQQEALPSLSLLGTGNPASNYTPPSSGDPVNDATGNFSETYTDASIPTPSASLQLTRTYNSLTASQTGPFGYGWSSSYTVSLAFGSGTATVNQEDGSQVVFTLSGSTYSSPAGTYATLVHNGDGTYTFVRRGTDVKRHVKWSRDLSRDGFLGATNQELVGR
jgi:hypothetical protein